MIFATRQLTPDVDAAFMASIATFHRLSLQDAANVHPQHLALVVAKPGDTAESLAASMTTQARAVDYFRMINGLADNAKLVPGREYKVIAQ